MGIVNVTPDSFSDGGAYDTSSGQLHAALHHCEQLLKDGADMLDIGGESSRPGAQPVPLAQELARVLPVVRHAVTLGVPISVDTYKPQVMQAVLDLGADIINDIWALRQGDAAEVVARHSSCGVCLMHMIGEPSTMQAAPLRSQAVAEALSFLEQRVEYLRELEVNLSRIVLDPGIGFGKTAAQNFALLAQQTQLLSLGLPLLVGWSRKSALATLGDAAMQERLIPSVAAALLAVERGARIVRVHDVRQTVQALAVWMAAISIE